MKATFRVVLALTLLPLALGLLGLILSRAFSCSGMDHIETCAVPGGQAIVAPLIAFLTVSVFVVPVGCVALAILAIIERVVNTRGRNSD